MALCIAGRVRQLPANTYMQCGNSLKGEMNEKVIVVEIAKLELKEGDILVVRFPVETHLDRMRYGVSAFKEVVPGGIPIIFFHGDVELSVISKDAESE